MISGASLTLVTVIFIVCSSEASPLSKTLIVQKDSPKKSLAGFKNKFHTLSSFSTPQSTLFTSSFEITNLSIVPSASVALKLATSCLPESSIIVKLSIGFKRGSTFLFLTVTLTFCSSHKNPSVTLTNII